MLRPLATPPGCCLALGPKEKACPFYLLSHSLLIQGGLGRSPKRKQNVGEGLALADLAHGGENGHGSEEEAPGLLPPPPTRRGAPGRPVGLSRLGTARRGGHVSGGSCRRTAWSMYLEAAPRIEAH